MQSGLLIIYPLTRNDFLITFIEIQDAKVTNKHYRREPAFKAKVALASLRDSKSLKELADHYNVHPTQISKWKHQLIDRAEMIFRMNA